MKRWHSQAFLHNNRKGAMVILLVVALGAASFFIADEYAKDSMQDYKIARSGADGFRAKLLAKAGLEGAVGALIKIPEEYLYKTGIAFNPPPIPLAGGMIFYQIYAEDGKFNLNALMDYNSGEPNLKSVEVVTRIFENLGLDNQLVYPIIDWIDSDNNLYGAGAESAYYSSLTPPRKIKNAPLYSMSEILSIKDFTRKIVYESLKPEDYDKQNSDRFLSDDEKALVSDSDFILSNNVTAYLPFKNSYDERVNLNAAPYFVLMSLSEFMTKAAVMRLLKLKLQLGGFIKDAKELEKLQEFQIPTTEGLTLYNELVGDGTDVSTGRIKTKGEIYKIIGVGQVGNTVRRITAIFDVTNRVMLYYLED